VVTKKSEYAWLATADTFFANSDGMKLENERNGVNILSIFMWTCRKTVGMARNFHATTFL
jgi:hypothetical protein